MNTNQPQIIFMYGPAGSGKGTQTASLLKQLPNYETLDIGPALKEFVKNNIYSADHELMNRAVKMNTKIESGLAVDIEDWQFVVGDSITSAVQAGRNIILDGAIRSLPQASFLGRLVKENELESCVVHIHVTLPEALRRIKNRWYIPLSSTIYPSYQEADRACASLGSGVLPFQRADDIDEAVVVRRYTSMYEEVWAPMLSVWQHATHDPIYVINGEQNVEAVTDDIMSMLV